MRAIPMLRALGFVAALLAGASGAAGQEVSLPAVEALKPRTLAAPTFDATTLSLAEAVRLTVLFSPAVTQATQTLEAAVGRHREAGGTFDRTVTIAPRVLYIQQPVSPFMLTQQRDTRTLIKTIYDGYSQVTVELRQMADSLKPRAPFCPAIGGSLLNSYDFHRQDVATLLETNSIYQDLLDDQEKSQIGAISDYSVPGLPDFNDLAAKADFCSMTARPDPLIEAASYFNMLDKVKNVDFWGSHTAGTVIESLLHIPREQVLIKAQIADAVASRARLAWERLGLLPEDEIKRQFTFDASFTQPFRSGITFTATAQMLSGEQSFKDKPFDPSFGGLGVPTKFKPEITAGLNVPLGKGRGATAAAAPERAAGLAVNARREQVRHAASAEVLRTVLAYFDLIATQETVALAQQSMAIVEKIQQLTEQQISAGDLPAVEIDRVKARAASLRAMVTDATSSLNDARIGLANNIGLQPWPGMTTLRAAETFATTVARVAPSETLVRQALAARRDYRSLTELTKATEALDAGARADRRRRIDLGVRGGLSNLYESPFFKFLPDEEIDVPLFSCNQNRSNLTPECVLKPGHSTETPVRFFDAAGFSRAITKRWEPFVEARVTIELPFGNNAARGRAKQTDADVRARRIELNELERSMSQTLVSTSRNLETAAAGLDHLGTAVTHDAQVVDLSLQQFAARELTLIDVLQTEEQVTQDRLSLVRQRQAYLSLLARLKYETGELLASTGQGHGDLLTFDPAGFVTK